MWSTTDTTAALVTARNDKLALTDVKAGVEGKKDQKKTGQLLESLGAVVPTGVTALYTTVAIALHQQALSAGVTERSALRAEMVTAKKPAGEIDKAIAALAQESESYANVRIALLVLAGVVALAMVYRAAADANRKAAKKRRLVIAEPVAAVVAFAGWSLASPGTPLGAYLTVDEMATWTLVIAAAAGLVLVGLGNVLSKPAGQAK